MESEKASTKKSPGLQQNVTKKDSNSYKFKILSESLHGK